MQHFDSEFVENVAVELGDSAAGSWQVALEKCSCSDEGVEIWRLALKCATDPAMPPQVKIAFSTPLLDMQNMWTCSGVYGILPAWSGERVWDIAHGVPLECYYSQNGLNGITIALSDARRRVSFRSGVREETCNIEFKLVLFAGDGEPPIESYETFLRIDRRRIAYYEAVQSVTRWYEAFEEYTPCDVPATAFEPLYSSWYNFHQDVHDADIEAECRIAADCGMRTIILDDGWQTDDTNRGYAFCGDWVVSKNRFADMPAHVKRVHELGMKYMVWYSVPFMGTKSRNYKRFEGKYLGERLGAGVLDPRYPEVREFIVSTYLKAVVQNDLDGLKLDFIDSFRLYDNMDPAARNNYEGCDITSIPLAVDRLMTDIMNALRAVRPDILIEFRQQYMGPAIRKYGNMIRAADCPASVWDNRSRIASLRLTSGSTAVHSDMLEWSSAEKVEVAALQVVNVIFSVVQYSMMLRNLPPDHLRMVRFWADFATRHRAALLQGSFRPLCPECGYPLLEGESSSERVIAVYARDFVVHTGSPDRDIVVINGTNTNSVIIDCPKAPVCARITDSMGTPMATCALQQGFNRVDMPLCGVLTLTF